MTGWNIIMLHMIRRLRHERRAAVMIEMAFAIPFLILIGFSGLEIANMMLTQTRISQIGLSAADNASRIAFGSSLSQPSIREIDINEVFTGVEEQASGLNFATRGRVILSSLEQNDDDGQWIHWQRCYGSLNVASEYGLEGTGATGKDFKGMGPAGQEVTASTGTAVMFIEISYDYEPLLFGKALGSLGALGTRRIRSTAAFNIREGRDLSQVYNPSPSVTVSRCT